MEYSRQDAPEAAKASLRLHRLVGFDSFGGECFARWVAKDMAAALEWLFTDGVKSAARSEDGKRPAWMAMIRTAVREGLDHHDEGVSRVRAMLLLIPQPWRSELCQSDFPADNAQYGSSDPDAMLRRSFYAVSRVPEPEIQKFLERWIIREFAENRGRFNDTPAIVAKRIESARQAGQSVEIPLEAVIQRGELDQNNAALMLQTALPERKNEVLPALVRRWIWLNSGRDYQPITDLLASYPPETPGLDRARLLVTKQMKRNSHYPLFESRLPLTDPQYHDQAVAGWLQEALEMSSQSHLRNLYQQSEVARGWSPELRARVEEIISAARS